MWSKCLCGWSGERGLCDLFQKNMDKISWLTEPFYKHINRKENGHQFLGCDDAGNERACKIMPLESFVKVVSSVKTPEIWWRPMWNSHIWLKISLAQAMSIRILCACVCECVLSCALFFMTTWTVAYWAPLSHRVIQARTLEWVIIFSFMGSFWPRQWTRVSPIFCLCRGILWRPLWLSW